jgi:nucleoside-diphosphate-sugar epimerase
VTGATGFLGWHIAEAFRDAGWRVRAVVRPGNRRALPAGIDAAEALLTDAASHARAFAESAAVVHAAGLVRAPSRRAFDAVNVDGTAAVVDAVNTMGIPLILMSSQAAAGPGTIGQPTRERDPLQPVNAYGHSKLAAEQVVRERARGDWTILRPSAVYGPRDRAFLPAFRLAARGVFPLVSAEWLAFSLVHVDDLARAVVTAAACPGARHETLFLGHRDPVSTGTLLRALADAFGTRYRPLRLPPWTVRLAALAGDASWKLGLQPIVDSARLAELTAPGFVCAVDRAADVLGFSATVPLREGIERTARWYRAQGWL